jgi:hypothetical protein
MRASTCDTVSRLCVRPVCCWFAFPLVPALAPPAPRRIAPPCSPASQLLRLGPTSRVRSSSANGFPSRCGPEAGLPWPYAGSPKFRRDPFARDLLFDPGRADMASLSGPVRVAFDSLHGLRSCDDPLRGSITHPTQPLCTLRGRRHRRLTQHSLPGCLLGITWVGLAPTDRASFAWRLRRGGPIADYRLTCEQRWSKDFLLGDRRRIWENFQTDASQACIVDDRIDLLIALT